MTSSNELYHSTLLEASIPFVAIVMLLIDTSVWILVFRDQTGKITAQLAQIIQCPHGAPVPD